MIILLSWICSIKLDTWCIYIAIVSIFFFLFFLCNNYCLPRSVMISMMVDDDLPVVLSVQLTTVPFRWLLTGLISMTDSSGKLLWGETLEKVKWVLLICKYVVSLKVERIREYVSSPVLENRLMPHLRELPVTLQVNSSWSPVQVGAVSGGLMTAVAESIIIIIL